MKSSTVETKLCSWKIEVFRDAVWGWQGQAASLGCGVGFWQAVSWAGSAASLSNNEGQQHLVW